MLLAALGIFQSVEAHGRVKSWALADGSKPGDDYGAVAPDTAQRIRGDNLDSKLDFFQTGCLTKQSSALSLIPNSPVTRLSKRPPRRGMSPLVIPSLPLGHTSMKPGQVAMLVCNNHKPECYQHLI